MSFGWRLTNRVWRLLHGHGFYQITGEQKKTLSDELNLQPGELVEIKSPAEIEATLDAQGRNRGLSFEPEMALHCGRRYRVATPVRTIIAEETGKMVQLSNTVILDGWFARGFVAKTARGPITCTGARFGSSGCETKGSGARGQRSGGVLSTRRHPSIIACFRIPDCPDPSPLTPISPCPTKIKSRSIGTNTLFPAKNGRSSTATPAASYGLPA